MPGKTGFLFFFLSLHYNIVVVKPDQVGNGLGIIFAVESMMINICNSIEGYTE
jgi:hypothetical protein